MTQPTAAQALRELAEDVRDLRVHAIDSPVYRHAAHDVLAAVLELIERKARDVPHGAVCRFPDCRRTADPETRMCERHKAVRITSSFVDDRHTDGGHG